MRNTKPHPPQVRAEAEALLRRGAMTQSAIARQVNVPRATVARWHRELGRAVPQPVGAPLQPRWTRRQREALLRLLTVPDLDPRDLGQAFGLPRLAARRVFSQAGLPLPPARRATMPGVTTSGAPEPAALARALRGHVARQIAAFDKRLAGREPDLDSARVLRDLAGLRRLIDDLRAPLPPSATDRDSDASVPDLSERRARLVGRLAVLAPGELAERLSRRA